MGAVNPRGGRVVEHYLEFGGGLGDVFNQIYRDGDYRFVERLPEGDNVQVGLVCHNPHAGELFAFGPHAGRVTIRNFGYWGLADDTRRRAELAVPRKPAPRPSDGSPISFHPSADDERVLARLDLSRAVVFAVSAGLPERSLPETLVQSLAAKVGEAGWTPIFIGRTYPRHGRSEIRPSAEHGVDLIDALSVPGVAVCLERSAGLVCCHSAINILAWWMRKPQLLLYPLSVYHAHIVRKDAWGFGADFAECVHGVMNPSAAFGLADEFLDRLG